MVIWVTGLAGAGKTTFARKVSSLVRSEFAGVVHLDGDELRKIFGRESESSYSREKRLELARSYAQLANSLSCQGLIVIISTISLFKEIHDWNRRNISQYIEILLNPPLSVLRKRDQKNLYSKYDYGTEKNIFGLDLKFDLPEYPDFHFTKADENDLHQVVQKVVASYKGEKNGN